MPLVPLQQKVRQLQGCTIMHPVAAERQGLLLVALPTLQARVRAVAAVVLDLCSSQGPL
jgi:hypothetical protein